MPEHNISLTTRQLIILMEMSREIVGDTELPHGERRDAAEMYHQANFELGYIEDGERVRV